MHRSALVESDRAINGAPAAACASTRVERAEQHNRRPARAQCVHCTQRLPATDHAAGDQHTSRLRARPRLASCFCSARIHRIASSDRRGPQSRRFASGVSARRWAVVVCAPQGRNGRHLSIVRAPRARAQTASNARAAREHDVWYTRKAIRVVMRPCAHGMVDERTSVDRKSDARFLHDSRLGHDVEYVMWTANM